MKKLNNENMAVKIEFSGDNVSEKDTKVTLTIEKSKVTNSETKEVSTKIKINMLSEDIINPKLNRSTYFIVDNNTEIDVIRELLEIDFFNETTGKMKGFMFKNEYGSMELNTVSPNTQSDKYLNVNGIEIITNKSNIKRIFNSILDLNHQIVMMNNEDGNND